MMDFSQKWDDFLSVPFGRQPHRQTLERALLAYESGTVYPPKEQLFAAFAGTAPEQVRVVILGQDPYHGAWQSEARSDEESEPASDQILRCAQDDKKRTVPQANGLAFSVNPGVPLPPSLRNMFRELEADLGVIRTKGDLSDWAAQGVLLLNTVLTVEAGSANSHRDLGWQAFTDEVIASLKALPQPIAFVLWGSQAQKKRALTESAYPRLVLESAHPSPLSAYRGFFGSRPFSQINRFLSEHGEPPIQWAADS